MVYFRSQKNNNIKCFWFALMFICSLTNNVFLKFPLDRGLEIVRYLSIQKLNKKTKIKIKILKFLREKQNVTKMKYTYGEKLTKQNKTINKV